MAKSGKKSILLPIYSSDIDAIEEIIEFGNHKAKTSGLRLGVEYTHDMGIKFVISGPKDKINQFEHQVRDFLIERKNADA
ncbi:MAG: hypothetical protein ACTSWW_01905 [Promethearchaeota archaeon]